MPSHAKNVKQYTDSLPLFARYQVESYLSSMFNPTVQLRSGGYIVIGVTEALVAIDVNSGRATKEGSIEETALKTNLEASEEVARQLRLRDLAGLIVIDFIDMEERKNNNAVEKRLKDRLKTDRARIQVGRISGFGLLEMSRQRLRPGMIEATTQPCPSCHGTGLIRSDDNLALSILRQIEEEGVRRRSREVLVKCPVGIANYLMNQKREHIAQIEARYGLSVRIEGDPHLVSPDHSLEKFKTATRVIAAPSEPVVSVDTSLMEQIDADIDETPEVDDAANTAVNTADNSAANSAADEDPKPKKKRRRRRRRSSSGRPPAAQTDGTTETGTDTGTDTGTEAADASADATGDTPEPAPQGEPEPAKPAEVAKADDMADATAAEPVKEAEAEKPPKPAKTTRSRSTKSTSKSTRSSSKSATKADDKTAEATADAPEATETAASAVVSDDAPAPQAEADKPKPAPKRTRSTSSTKAKSKSADKKTEAEPKATNSEPVAASAAQSEAKTSVAPAPEPAVAAPSEPAATVPPEPAVAESAVAEPAKPKKRGWWSLGS